MHVLAESFILLCDLSLLKLFYSNSSFLQEEMAESFQCMFSKLDEKSGEKQMFPIILLTKTLVT